MQMESVFQKPQQKESTVKEICKKMKSSSSSRTTTKRKFVGVRQRPSGKWVAEIKNTSQKIRIWLGTFGTAEEAAFAYDEAACILRGSNTRTNFVCTPSSNNTNSALSRRIRNLVNQKRMLINNSNSQPTPAPAPAPAPPSIVKPTHIVADNSLVSFTSGEEKPDVFDYSWAQFPADDLGIFSKQVSFAPTFPEAGIMSSPDEIVMLEFERMKVERQISASLYAMNGVNDYLHSVFNASCDSADHDHDHDPDPATPTSTWDPRFLYHNFCLG